MIDWTKRIEAVDGRKARVIETIRLELWLLVWVASENEGPGDVYIVDVEGCRCDSRSIEMGLQTSQFIRNVRVKRVAWCLVSPQYCIVKRKEYYRTEELAKEAARFGEIVARIEWEE